MHRRTPLHIALLVSASLGAGVLSFFPADAIGQHSGGNGTVVIHSETERQLFWSLICTCGCPRETLGTCACDIASGRREALRDLLAQGKTIEQAQDAYVAMYGIKSLAVPRNQGANRLLWAVPAFAIMLGAGFVVYTLRRFQRRGAAIDAAKKAKAKTSPVKDSKGRDDYDDRLDQELKDLDNE
ncbi:MAG: cytochrome c-type biogenesis protein CcmH [Polyangiaceae bacterium]|nr:cytochrome c-type biogenesis protein CcmH [Polyangiaceae bacterium]